MMNRLPYQEQKAEMNTIMMNQLRMTVETLNQWSMDMHLLRREILKTIEHVETKFPDAALAAHHELSVLKQMAEQGSRGEDDPPLVNVDMKTESAS